MVIHEGATKTAYDGRETITSAGVFMANILFFQAGNYGEAYRRFRDGGPETYRDQRASVDFVARLSEENNVTTAAVSNDPHDDQLTPTLRSIGISYGGVTADWVSKLFDELKPDRAIVRMPHHLVLAEAKKRRVATLPTFADIFANDGPKAIYRNLRLRRTLTGDHIPGFSNHSLNATRSLCAALKIPKDKAVPWDWSRIPLAGPAKEGISDPSAPSVFFAGALTEPKGVGDVIRAVAAARQQGHPMTAAFAGPGDQDAWRSETAKFGIEKAITFLGLVPHDEVREQMKVADMVIVPSRHSYPEGLPNTIYEGLASRSPLIVSDHPAFAGRVQHETDCLVFKAGDAEDLATCFARLCTDSALYATISQNAEAASDGLYVGLEWTELVQTFLNDPQNKTGWVEQNALAALGY